MKCTHIRCSQGFSFLLSGDAKCNDFKGITLIVLENETKIN